jgi:succinyl-diaminopimelate desuccinylase
MNLEQQIVDLTSELIRIPSAHSRPDEIRRCADFIETWLARRDIAYQRSDIAGVPAITVLPRPQATEILLMAHFDVVEVQGESQFIPRQQDGRLFGRGAIDDKYAVALALILFHNRLEDIRRAGGTQGDMCFGLLLNGDEEVGGGHGALAVLEKMALDFGLALDGGNPGTLVTKEKGILQLRLTARGKGAHAARPWLGQNAFNVLVSDYQALQKQFAEQTPDHWHKTMVLSNCRVGDGSINIVPAVATATLDIRYTENEDPDAILAAIEATVDSEVTLLEKEPLFIGGASPYLETLVACIPGVHVGFEHGASDARYLTNRGIPGVVWGAAGEMSQHAADEHVVISSLGTVYSCLDKFFAAIESKKSP